MRAIGQLDAQALVPGAREARGAAQRIPVDAGHGAEQALDRPRLTS